MSPADRWGRVEELFGSLFEMSVEERQLALDAVPDADLRAEVCELLSTHQELTSGNGGFLEGLDSIRASALLERSPTSGDPSTIGRYRIVRRLARGGMGVVYLAHDSRLERPVALKLLSPYLNADPTAVRRLGDEARAASALDHPHIETVYEIGEADDGRVFISMAYYDGETLRERIGRGPMAVPEVIELGMQLARGLAAAHRSGIIHRDIKPENILVTGDGTLKIVDFGVAKVMREGLASAGLPLGTAAYMSPEQTRGEALNHRTDLWSMGVVLYEMLSGARPFGGHGEALIHAIRHDPPTPLSMARAEIPPALVSIVERCLQKDRKDRLDSAEAVAAEIRVAASGGVPTDVRIGLGRRLYQRWGRMAASILLPAAVLIGILIQSGAEVSPLADDDVVAPGIAVLPFEVRGDDLDVLRDGMVDLLSINLDGVAGMRAIDSRTVIARWEQALQEGGTPSLERSLDIARSTGARFAVIGGIVSSGPGIRLTARVHSLEDGRSLAPLQIEGPADSLFALVDRLSIDILAALWQGRERPHQEVDLSRITTTSLPALKYFLEGENLLRRADFEGATAAFERAIAADSTFAFAHFHLGLAAGWVGDELRHNRAYQGALRHAGRLPEREALLLQATLAAHARAINLADEIGQLLEITRRYPDDADAWYYLGDRYWHDGEQVLAGQEESEKAFRKVVELDPGYTAAYIHLVNNAFIYRPDSARAARLLEIYHRHAPNSVSDHENEIAFGLAFGDSTRRRRSLEALDTLGTPTRQWLADGYLDHPRFWSVRSALIERAPLPDTWPGRLMAIQLFDTSLSQGDLRKALVHLEDPLVPPGWRASGLYRIQSAGPPISGLALDLAIALPRTDSLPGDLQSLLIWFYVGAFAADRARWHAHTSAVGHLQARADRFLADGDSASARFARGAATALRGQGLWRRGNAERALPILMTGQREATWRASPSREALNETIRWWIGELLLQSGRPREAATYFAASWHDPWAAERLGPIYERIGEPDKAREAYALVAMAWADALELQPRARAARAAVERLDRTLEK